MTEKIAIFENSGKLLEKVVREAQKAHFANTETDLQDAFFNFCITAHSVRDWCIKELNLSGKEKDAFYTFYNEYKYLEYVRDVANGSKHCGLDVGKVSTVKDITTDKTAFAYIGMQGNIEKESESEPSIKLILPDGESVLMFTFLNQVIRSLRSIMDSYGLPYDKEKCNPANAFIAFLPLK